MPVFITNRLNAHSKQQLLTTIPSILHFHSHSSTIAVSLATTNVAKQIIAKQKKDKTKVKVIYNTTQQGWGRGSLQHNNVVKCLPSLVDSSRFVKILPSVGNNRKNHCNVWLDICHHPLAEITGNHFSTIHCPQYNMHVSCIVETAPTIAVGATYNF
jgi:hypothetical protein